MFFTSNAEGTKGGFDIWYAEKIDDGAFGAPINLGAVINTEGEEATPFYQNGKLYFSSNGHTNIGGLDIFSSNWNGATWSKPENMGKGYNSAANDSYFTLDADGNAYFTSNRVGGKSLKSKTCCDDIYTVKKPPVIIDVIADVTDGKQALKGINYQLIDMTSGRKGATDAKTADKYTSTLALKRAYMIIASKAGYYSDSVQINTLDILETTTNKKTLTMRPLPVITVALRAKAQSGGADLKGVTFTLIEIGGRSDSRTLDAYGAALNREKSYMLIAGKAGYTPDTAKFDTKGIAATTEIEKVLNLKPRIITVKRNEAIKLNNIFYKLDKFEASEAHMENFVEAQQSLDYLYNIMVKYPEMVIELSSHTDSRGSDAYNMTLSQKRADGAKAYLLSKGVAEKRVVAKGYGETQLVNRCANGVKCSDEEHLQNRRTEFKIISGPTTIEIIEQQPAVKN